MRRQLADRVVGRRVASVEIGRPRSVRRTSPAAVVDGLTGRTITSAGRRGKYLVLSLDNDQAVMIHLRMSGQVLLADPASPRPLHTHVAARLDGSDERGTGEELRFVDPRTFGEVVVFDRADPDRLVPELGRLGIDPVADPFGLSTFVDLVRSSIRVADGPGFKAFLVDQRRVAGIGNIYSDEIAHRTHIHPLRPIGTLRRASIVDVHRAIVDILTEAIERRGSSLPDSRYVDVMGERGSYQEHHLVYGSKGRRCPTCRRGVIATVTAAGRTSHYCPSCQRLPRSKR